MSFALRKDRGQKTEDKGWNLNPLSFVLKKVRKVSQ